MERCGGERRPDIVLDLVQDIGDVSQELVDTTDLASSGGLTSQQGSKHHHDHYDDHLQRRHCAVPSINLCRCLDLCTWMMTTEFLFGFDGFDVSDSLATTWKVWWIWLEQS